jgi:hypothetical protein
MKINDLYEEVVEDGKLVIVITKGPHTNTRLIIKDMVMDEVGGDCTVDYEYKATHTPSLKLYQSILSVVINDMLLKSIHETEHK